MKMIYGICALILYVNTAAFAKGPPDLRRVESGPSGTIGIFVDRIEFFKVKEGFKADSGGLLKDGVRLKPFKTLLLAQQANLSAASGDNFVLCQDTRLSIRKKGLKDFCGIMSITGETVFAFPLKEHAPDTVLNIIGVTDNGSYGEIWIGELVDGEDGREPGKPRAIYGWRYPNHFKQVAGPWKKGELDAGAWSRLFSQFGGRNKIPWNEQPEQGRSPN